MRRHRSIWFSEKARGDSTVSFRLGIPTYSPPPYTVPGAVLTRAQQEEDTIEHCRQAIDPWLLTNAWAGLLVKLARRVVREAATSARVYLCMGVGVSARTGV